MTPDLVTRLLLVRHGETAASAGRERILQGRELDLPLSEAGVRQAARVAGLLARTGCAAVYSSPLLRAVETARMVAARQGVEVRVEEDLAECGIGRWSGLTWEAIEERFPEELRAFRSDPVRHGYPGGERYDQLLDRLLGVFAELFDRHGGESFACVGHSVTNRVFLSHLLGLPLDRSWNLPQAAGCVNVVTRKSGRMQVETVSSVFHLETTQPARAR